MAWSEAMASHKLVISGPCILPILSPSCNKLRRIVQATLHNVNQHMLYIVAIVDCTHVHLSRSLQNNQNIPYLVAIVN